VPTGTVVDVGDNSTSTDEDQRANGKIVRLPEEVSRIKQKNPWRKRFTNNNLYSAVNKLSDV
jgi:L-2-hydroxyglutarate oxidase LhgO